MEIKRLKLDVEYKRTNMQAFYTDGDTGEDPPTIIKINNKEYEGELFFQKDGDEYIVIIKKGRRI